MANSVAICDVILLAAGASRRMGGIKKQFAEIDGHAVYKTALSYLISHPAIASIVLVVPEQDLARLLQAHEQDKVIVVSGAQERALSVRCGLAALADSKSPFIAIHDAARPVIPHEVISSGIERLQKGHKAVVPALPVADTIKQVSPSDPSVVEATLSRDRLRRIQTPQFFEKPLIHKLHETYDMPAESITDDALLAEKADVEVCLISGDHLLEKITWPADLQQRKESQMAFEYRTGTGFDVHRFTSGTGPIMICGLAVDHDMALDAHSDGDVGIHALCDAIFGALCDGDIGMHFPPSDPKWKDATSDQFLLYAVDKIQKAGGKLCHIDVTILCETPKIGPHRDAMRDKLAALCNMPVSSVSVKATTTERLGFTGRGEGIAAQAAATITLPQKGHDL
ncbi:MAG: 2-C-methyl-D-erythritol 4-phosphate cytidylyltransferase [Candidatus Puniceispirillaceae bacterium]